MRQRVREGTRFIKGEEILWELRELCKACILNEKWSHCRVWTEARDDLVQRFSRIILAAVLKLDSSQE